MRQSPLRRTLVLPPLLCDGMGSCALVHSPDSSYCDRVSTPLQHARIQSTYRGSYPCNLFASEIVLVQLRASCIGRMRELPPVAPSELCGLKRRSSDHHTLVAVVHQSPSHDPAPV